MASAARQPTIVFLSVHKGASTFLAADLAPAACRVIRRLEHVRIAWHELRGTALDAMPLPPRGVIATRVYPDQIDRLVEDPAPAGRFADKRLVVVRRDPRDAAVSLFYSRAFSHRVPPGSAAAFLAERERLRAMTPAEGVRAVTAAETIAEFRATDRFLERFPQACDAPYELLVTDFDAWFDRVAAHVGWTGRVADRIARGLDVRVAAPAEDRPTEHKRRVTPGNWREVFDEDLAALFEGEIGTEMQRAGYVW